MFLEAAHLIFSHRLVSKGFYVLESPRSIFLIFVCYLCLLLLLYFMPFYLCLTHCHNLSMVSPSLFVPLYGLVAPCTTVNSLQDIGRTIPLAISNDSYILQKKDYICQQDSETLLMSQILFNWMLYFFSMRKIHLCSFFTLEISSLPTQLCTN